MNRSEKFCERLLRWRSANDLKSEEAAQVLGIGRSYYSQLENDKRRPSRFLEVRFNEMEDLPVNIRELQRTKAVYQDNLKCEESFTVKEDTPSPLGHGLRRVPLIGWTQAGLANDYTDIVEWDDFQTVQIDDPNAIAVRVRGDSMEPQISEGDIVVLACSAPPETGDTVVARLRNEGVVCKRFQVLDPQKRIFRLSSLNEIYAPIERSEQQFHWIYPVDQLIKKMRKR